MKMKNELRDKDKLFMLSIRKIAEDIQLKEMKNGREIRVIAITSPFDNDGKSEISIHLAQEFAILGEKTLLLSFKETVGIEHSIVNLDFFSMKEAEKATGPIAGRTAFAAMLNQLKSKYRRIIIDTEALEGSLSGFLAASNADGVYFVCNRRNLQRGQLERYHRRLKDIGANILGIIYNNAARKMVEKAYAQDGERYG